MAVQTQWRVGMGGPTGLDYAGVLAWMQAGNVAKRDRAPLLEKLQIMERTTLAEWARKAERERSRTPRHR